VLQTYQSSNARAALARLCVEICCKLPALLAPAAAGSTQLRLTVARLRWAGRNCEHSCAVRHDERLECDRRWLIIT